MTIGTLLDLYVDKSRTASFVGLAVVVAIEVVVACVVVTSLHS